MLQGAGITDNHTRLLYNGCQNVVSFGGAVIGAIFTDRWGRRRGLLVSTTGIVIIFCIITALNATNTYTAADGTILAKSSASSKTEIAFIFIFGFVYSAGWTPLQALYPVEVLRYESRAKGMGFYNFWVNIAGFYNTFVTGIAFTGAGWKYYFLFIFWDCLEVAVIYFLFVETKNRTLEELAEIFRSKNPVAFSLKKTKVTVIKDKQGNEVHEIVEKSEAS
jgi:MFS family permease